MRAAVLLLLTWSPWAFAAAEGEAPRTLANGSLGWGSLVQVGAGLLLVVALIGLLAWLVRRLGRVQGGAAGSLRILGGLSLGARERVVLLQVGERQLLLGVAPGRVQTLHVLETPLPDAVAGGADFAGQLRAVLGRGGKA